MRPTATHHEQGTTPERVLWLACARSDNTWERGFTTGPGHKPRERGVAARHQARGLQAVAPAKPRCGVPASAPVGSWDDAGREGCWRHRFVQAPGLTRQVGDASAREGNRRPRRAQREGVDSRQLLRLRLRLHQGEREVWRVGQGPAVDAEAPRHRHRDLERLTPERARPTTRIKGWRSRPGIRLTSLHQVPAPLAALRRWAGSPRPRGRRHRVRRVSAQHQLWRAPMAAVAAERRAVRETSQAASLETIRQLMHRQGLGLTGAWLVVMACLGWRAVKTRREGGGVAGVTPTPDPRGERARAQGLTTSGTRHVRGMTTELAWSGRRDPPERALRGWFRERVSGGGKRLRRIGMVALARQWRRALGRCLTRGV